MNVSALDSVSFVPGYTAQGIQVNNHQGCNDVNDSKNKTPNQNPDSAGMTVLLQKGVVNI